MREYKHYIESIRRPVAACLDDYSIELKCPVVVGLSGGKDSFALSLALSCLGYDVRPAIVDLGYQHFRAKEIIAEASRWGLEAIVVNIDDDIQDSAEGGFNVVEDLRVVHDPTVTAICTPCSRLRRRLLAKHAAKIGSSWAALGHHRDDFITTLMKDYFVSLYYERMGLYSPAAFSTFIAQAPIDIARLEELVVEGTAGTMAIHLKPTEQLSLIRPMAYVAEQEVVHFRDSCGLRTFPSECPHTVLRTHDPNTMTKREIVHREMMRRQAENLSLAKDLLRVALSSLDEKGAPKSNPRETRSARMPGLEP